MDGKNIDLHDPSLYINRELSLLDFDFRVLAQAHDHKIPLLERLRFLCICSANLDELFEIRVANLRQQLILSSVQIPADGLNPQEVLNLIHDKTTHLVTELYKILNDELLPALAKEDIHFISSNKWTAAQKAWLTEYFRNEILPVVSPIGLDLAHPWPRLVNKSLNFMVTLEGKDAFGRASRLAIVHAPRALPRLIQLPPSHNKNRYDFVMLSDVIAAYANELFPGMTITGCYQFRITRNSDLLLDEDTQDLAVALKNKLQTIRYGTAVRLEIAADCPQEIIDFILKQHQLTINELYKVNGPVNLARYLRIFELINRPDLKYPPFIPGIPKLLQKTSDLFAAMRQKDILLHHPYQSFAPVINLIHQATVDPQVIAIKQTLYRTGTDSQVVRALIDAARAGKEVTAVIELRARFDEESNLELANNLQEAGALVVYGVVTYKTHAKLLLIVRREKEKLIGYSHLGTGNYHVGTAKQYTDFSLLTCDPIICADVQNVFQQLTGTGKIIKLKKLWDAPFIFYKSLVSLIEREITHVKTGKPAKIIIKVNALTDSKMIRKLYAASHAGVQIELIVRGICCLRPGVTGVSDNIKVRSVVGRFLEHERVYYFYNNGEEEVYCASADLMERNIYHRVEVCFPITNKRLAKRVIEEALLFYLSDNQQAWQLQSDGSYQRIPSGKSKKFSAQAELLNKLSFH